MHRAQGGACLVWTISLHAHCLNQVVSTATLLDDDRALGAGWYPLHGWYPAQHTAFVNYTYGLATTGRQKQLNTWPLRAVTSV